MADEITKDTVSLAIKEALEKQNENHKLELEKIKNTYESKIKSIQFTPLVKEVFLKNGGNEKAFNAFISVNKKDLEAAEDLNKSIKSLAKQQDYFFGRDNKKEDNNDNDNIDVDIQLKEKKLFTSEEKEKKNSKKYYDNTLYGVS